MTTDLKMGKTEWGLLILLPVIWGGSFFVSKVTLAEIPPFTLVFSRVFLAAGALYLTIRIAGQKLGLSLPLIGAFFGMGLIGLGLVVLDGRVFKFFKPSGKVSTCN